MSEPTKEELLRFLDGEIEHQKMAQEALHGEWSPGGIIKLKAIRRLIEKLFEWQGKARNIVQYEGKKTAKEGDCYLSFIRDIGPAIKIIEEIRDFGKEAIDEHK